MVRLATLDPCVGPFAQIDRRRHAGELFAFTRQIILQLDGRSPQVKRPVR
ncbi:hypothetical protein GR247_00060 [Rhizobium leguminosarum]|nr:hypothetical protein [Rhizobium ruizarguesonis]NEJ18565.1 hypothetical protein [Rhizobium leguminosarum]